MIRHIVIWKLKEDAKMEDVLKLKELSNTLKDIKSVVDVEFLVNPSKGSTHQMCLISVHNTIEDLEAYAVDPVHVEFGSHLKPLVCERVCYNYEI